MCGAVIPGVKSASINCAEYFSPATTGSGPISAIRFPWLDLQFSSSMVINHTFPNDSITVPRGPLSACAATRVGYASRCQNTRGFASCPKGLSARIQHPISCVRALTGLHGSPRTATPCATSCVHKRSSRQKKRIPFNRTCPIIYLNLKFIGGYQGQIVSGQCVYVGKEMNRKLSFQVLAVLWSEPEIGLSKLSSSLAHNRKGTHREYRVVPEVARETLLPLSRLMRTNRLLFVSGFRK